VGGEKLRTQGRVGEGSEHRGSPSLTSPVTTHIYTPLALSSSLSEG
jgi:hypothetical protein